MASRPYLVLDFRALWRLTLILPACPKFGKSKTKNGRLAAWHRIPELV